jgi:hypothetical protein
VWQRYFFSPEYHDLVSGLKAILRCKYLLDIGIKMLEGGNVGGFAEVQVFLRDVI